MSPESPLADAAEPPAGDVWDCPIGQATFAFVDLEMTGLDQTRDYVVEVCIERVEGVRLRGRLETLVMPPERVGQSAQIHGLGLEALQGAPPFSEIADRVLELCDPMSSILVAHAASHDVAFLEAELARMGRPRSFPFFIDTLTLARRALAMPTHSLGALAVALGLAHDRPHRAADDVKVLRGLFNHLVDALHPASPRDLWHVRVGQRRARPEIVAACLEAAEHEGRVVLSYRPSHRAARPVEAVITRVRTDLDPPRVLGYALPGRGRFDLRADRILAVTIP